MNNKDWILVAQYGGSTANESFFTLSVIVDLNRIASANPDDIQLIDRLVYIPEGKTYLLKKVDYSEVLSRIFSDYYIPNSVIDAGNIIRNQESDFEIKDFADFHIISNSLIVRPFVYMQENRRLGIRYVLDQKFPLYYEAHKIKDEYFRIDENGDKIIIARAENGDGWMKCYVSATYLKDYLTLTGYGLWRYHTHYRHCFPKNENLGEFNSDKILKKTTTTDKKGYFKIGIPTNARKPRFVLNIWKEGYGLFSKIFFRGKQNGIWLLTKGTIHTIDPSKDNTIRDTPHITKYTGPLSSHIDISKISYRRLLRADKTAAIKKLLQPTPSYLDPQVIHGIRNKGIQVTIKADTLVGTTLQLDL